MSVIISIHDATAGSLPRIVEIAGALRESGCRSADILVVCGSDWTPRQIDALRRLEEQGFRLQGHGWTHRAVTRRDWFHRWHSRLLSRDVAEHLSRPAQSIRQLMECCHEWFERHRFRPPTLYVPPAWALGSVDRETLDQLPYRFYESLTGVYDSHDRRFRRLPLVGYEADTIFREVFLRAFNVANGSYSSLVGSPLRVSIHPDDLQMRLSRRLKRAILRHGRQGLCDVQSVIDGVAPPPLSPPADQLNSSTASILVDDRPLVSEIEGRTSANNAPQVANSGPRVTSSSR